MDSWKGALVAVVVLVTAVSVFYLGDPLFLANTSVTPPSDGVVLRVVPFLPHSPTNQWAAAGLEYTCSGAGPGVIEVIVGGQSGTSVVSLSLSYGGATYSATGPSCPVGPGSTFISITSLSGPAGGSGTSYGGYIVLADGTQVPFSGSWA